MKAKIGIDAGHGESYSGTYSVNSLNDGLFEKDFTLEQAFLIRDYLLKNGFAVVMTRTDDKNPGNVNERAKIVAKEKCDFALSIHFNGFKTESAKGTEVFVPYSEKFGGIETGFFNYLGEFFEPRKPFAKSSNYYNKDSVFDKKLNLETRKFDAVSSEKDYFGFIRSCWERGVSADLLEICFLTNEKDFKTYTENRREIAKVIAKSIVEGFGEKFVDEEKEKDKVIAKPKMKIFAIYRKNRKDMLN